MEFCPECGCLLTVTKSSVLCTSCNYSECRCELCSSQDEIKEVLADEEMIIISKQKGGNF